MKHTVNVKLEFSIDGKRPYNEMLEAITENLILTSQWVDCEDNDDLDVCVFHAGTEIISHEHEVGNAE